MAPKGQQVKARKKAHSSGGKQQQPRASLRGDKEEENRLALAEAARKRNALNAYELAAALDRVLAGEPKAPRAIPPTWRSPRLRNIRLYSINTIMLTFRVPQQQSQGRRRHVAVHGHQVPDDERLHCYGDIVVSNYCTLHLSTLCTLWRVIPFMTRNASDTFIRI